MNTHAHPATAYEREAAAKGRLEAIVLPADLSLLQPRILPKREMDGSTTFDTARNPRFFDELPYQLGDRIYLQERWAIDDTSDMYLTESDAPDLEDIAWEPAHTMPPEAAKHWYAIADVRVCQMKDLNPIDVIECGLYPPNFKDFDCLETFAECKKAEALWDASYFSYPWKAARWIIKLTLQGNAA